MTPETIAEAGVGEFAACAATIRAAFAPVAAAFRLTRETCPTHPSFLAPGRLARAVARGGVVFAAKAEGEIVGVFELSPAGEGAWALERLAVLPAHQGRGLGGRLVERAKAEASLRGATLLKAGIIAENRRLRDWYLARGFSPRGTERYAHLPFTVERLEAGLGG